jgi:hypothetical protein
LAEALSKSRVRLLDERRPQAGFVLESISKMPVS